MKSEDKTGEEPGVSSPASDSLKALKAPKPLADHKSDGYAGSVEHYGEGMYHQVAYRSAKRVAHFLARVEELLEVFPLPAVKESTGTST